jgi:hypothetical protein
MLSQFVPIVCPLVVLSETNKGVSAGHDWEKDDAVEIAVAELGGDGSLMLLDDGYTAPERYSGAPRNPSWKKTGL